MKINEGIVSGVKEGAAVEEKHPFAVQRGIQVDGHVGQFGLQNPAGVIGKFRAESTQELDSLNSVRRHYLAHRHREGKGMSKIERPGPDKGADKRSGQKL